MDEEKLLAWFDGKKIHEIAFCREFLREQQMVCVKGTFFTVDKRVTDERELKKRIYDKLKDFVSTGVARKVDSLLELLRAGKADLAILICGSGAGMAMLANKHRGIFAVPCESVQTARMARQFLNANVLTMGGYVVSPELAEEIADTFLTTAFAAGETEERKEYLNGQLRDLYLLDEACWKE